MTGEIWLDVAGGNLSGDATGDGLDEEWDGACFDACLKAVSKSFGKRQKTCGGLVNDLLLAMIDVTMIGIKLPSA